MISNYGQSKVVEYKKMIIRKWEYNIVYDTIAVTDDGKNETDNFFYVSRFIYHKLLMLFQFYQINTCQSTFC